MTIGGNIWMICLKLNWFFYGLSRMLQFSKFVWPLSYSVWDVFNNFPLIDATDRSKISSDQKRFFIALSLYPLSFFVNTPFKWNNTRSPLCIKKSFCFTRTSFICPQDGDIYYNVLIFFYLFVYFFGCSIIT